MKRRREFNNTGLIKTAFILACLLKSFNLTRSVDKVKGGEEPLFFQYKVTNILFFEN